MYTVTATRGGKTVRFERRGAQQAYATVRRLSALGWSVGLRGPGR